MSPRRSTVARQILVLQVLVVVVVVVGAVTLAYYDARRSQIAGARDRALAVAVSVADTPQVREALRTGSPSDTIQPFAEDVRRDSHTDFVVVMALDRTRYSHPDPAQIGKPFIGDLGTAPAGRAFTQEYTGTLGPSMRAVVPVFADGSGAAGGRVVALVSVGITMQRIQDALADRLPTIALAAALVLGTGLLGAWLISRRLRRQTHGLGEGEITRMYEYYDAVLHAVREGLLLVDTEDRVQLLNDEAKRLLDLDDSAVGRPVADLGFPESLTRAVLATDSRPDEIHLVDDAVLVVNTAPARWQGREVGTVVTLRDHTEIQAVAGELDTVRGLAESLRSQNHEAANRLHTVVSLVEMGRTEEALDFATEELEVAQLLTDRVVGSVSDPVVSALLLGKTAQAAERGVQLRIDDRTDLSALPIEQRDAVTILGNLVDNALDAVSERADRVVVVQLQGSAAGLTVRVSDSGAGVPAGLDEQVFRRGWSTKTSDGPVGRGLGLALVVQAVRKYDGRIGVTTSDLGGASFLVEIGETA
ncbi:ATP-binding protein [Nocardioides panacis]|uniref:ATP-binding protein n=1 Tax=Nocardioides panacis TaxID=2849501 RepID=UPI0020B3F374|nr:sensor histidine kinase [Nocardioides panacis]